MQTKTIETQECLSDRLNTIAMHKYWEYLSEDTIVTIFEDLVEDEIIRDWITEWSDDINLRGYLKEKAKKSEKMITELLKDLKYLVR